MLPYADSDTSVAFATRACNGPTSGTSPNVTLVVRDSGNTCTAKKRVAPEQERNRHRGLVNLYLTQVCIDKGMHAMVPPSLRTGAAVHCLKWSSRV